MGINLKSGESSAHWSHHLQRFRKKEKTWKKHFHSDWETKQAHRSWPPAVLRLKTDRARLFDEISQGTQLWQSLLPVFGNQLFQRLPFQNIRQLSLHLGRQDAEFRGGGHGVRSHVQTFVLQFLGKGDCGRIWRCCYLKGARVSQSTRQPVQWKRFRVQMGKEGEQN